VPDFVKNVVIPMNRQEGDSLPVSTFQGREDGEFPSGTAAYEKRGVAAFVPSWDKDKCIQCNQCSFVCPHSAVRPFLLDEAEAKAAPEGFETVDAKGKGLEGLKFRIQVSVLDCLGCSSCSNVCPVDALPMKPLGEEEDQAPNWDYAMTVSEKSDRMDKNSVKGSQFCMPYFEFSGACAGFGETPYIKVITQLYGDRMMIANATGCSSIWGASAPSMPYCKDKNGRGPSWANSLFEDNAEYGLGMATGVKQARNLVRSNVEALLEVTEDKNVRDAAKAWLDGFDEGEGTRDRAEKFAEALKASNPEGKARTLTREILKREDMLAKKSLWCLGGDGWSYDIGYGGLDHALASGEDINVLVFDTEVYSNTGGQSSKATPTGAVAQFAAAGKRTKKKDLGMMAMSYGYVYVAQVAIGADKNQFLKAVREAESYHGPSLIICYAPCINHGLKQGMGKSIENEGDAVKCGYWQIYRYNPVDKSFSLDCKEPERDKFRDFMMGQVRYSSLVKAFPDIAEELFVKTEEEAMERYQKYAELASK
ncbi:MAG: thiamine pyrophosphate-dependent enzyme, partial [Anaerovoracaceae bacterium]|nr:thiamine pyrophosphate-dependent enzyme [Anaerovoracaceae bacterium]